jgi:hypothetical protein
LSKDRLTWVRNSIYFNNANDYIVATNSKNTCMLGLVSNCVVFFVCGSVDGQSSIVHAAKKRGSSGISSAPACLPQGTKFGTWWLGWVQRIKQKAGTKWGTLRYLIELMNKSTLGGKKFNEQAKVLVLFNWFSKATSNLKFKYDVIDSK